MKRVCRSMGFLFVWVASQTITGGALEDMSSGEPYEPGTEYRLSITGIIGSVEDEYIQVTRVAPNSPVAGRVKPGDRVVRLQGRALSGNIRNTIRVQMLRLWRENDGRLSLTVLRPAENETPEKRFSLRLHLPPPPGTVQHVGPTGIVAAIHDDHIRVERLMSGSPADGKLQAGDQVRMVDNRPISQNLYGLFGEAIEQAETPERNGRMLLQVMRPAKENGDGENLEIELQLPVVGTRSRTSPRHCPRTDTLITRAADALVESGQMGRLNIGLLGLLSTGEDRYIQYVGQRLRNADFAKPDIQLSMSAGMTSWPWAYQLITLCEYYLLTGDEYVLPAIATYATTIAKGQDAAGLWNHRMADPGANFGQLHGRLYGYGAINQTSAALWIGLILAETCGIEEPELRRAIEKTHALYGNWVGKGALPYGNHGPMEHLLTNNGTSGSAAVGFALLNDAAGARFYALLSAASHEDVFTGHSGPFFNYLWSSLGANVLGPEVWAAYENALPWLRTMMRKWDGSFQYMEARGNVFDYSNLSATGAHLLNLAAGRRALHITGKEMDRSLWLEGQAAVEAVVRVEPHDEMEPAELLELLGSPLPPVRLEAARALGEQNADVADALLEGLRTGTRNRRIGALHAIAALKVELALEPLLAILKDPAEDLWIRELAGKTLPNLNGAQEHVMDLLSLIVADKPEDASRDLDRMLGTTVMQLLQPNPEAHDLDREIRYAAALKLLDHPHFWGRQQGMELLRNVPLEDFYRVADKIVYVIEDKDRRYTAYHGDGHRQAGLEILNRLNIREVIDLTIETIKEPTGREGARARNRKALLDTFGGEARDAIPRIQEVLGESGKDIVEKIQASETSRPMISLEEAKRLGRKRD